MGMVGQSWVKWQFCLSSESQGTYDNFCFTYPIRKITTFIISPWASQFLACINKNSQWPALPHHTHFSPSYPTKWIYVPNGVGWPVQSEPDHDQKTFSQGGRLPNKGRYGCAGPGIRYFRGQFLPRRKVLGDKFCLGIRFLAIFDKKWVIFDKRVKKWPTCWKIIEKFQFWHSL